MVRNRFGNLGKSADVWTLFDTSTAGRGTLEEYLHIVLDRCAEWFKASGASIFLHVEGTETYALAAKGGHESSVPDDAIIRRGEGIAGTCIAKREPILLSNPMNHPALADSITIRNKRLGSSIVVPLMGTDGGCIGVLNLSRTRRERAFSEDDLRYASSLAGHIALAVANGRLVSKLRLAVDEATRSHSKLDTVLSSLGVGIVVFDSGGNIEHLNPEAAALCTIPGPTNLRDLTNAIFTGLGEPLARVANQSMRGERSSAVGRVEAQARAFALAGSPLPGGGATVAIQDTTEHEQALQEVARVRRLAEIGQMTATIAHEIRNPLWAMRGAAQVIQSDIEHAAEFGKIIEEEVIKLSELCNGFLEFAKPIELVMEEVQLSEIAARLADRHRTQFDDAGVKLTVVTVGEPEPVRADSTRVEQVLRNLLLNALQATLRGGEVILTVSGSRVSVEDTGCGVEQEHLEKLFVPFFTTKADGSGLGLSTVKKIVDEHGAVLGVNTNPGQGSRFEINWGKQAA